MWYAFIGRDRPNSLEKRRQARDAHITRLTALQNEGRLLLAGPFPATDCEDPGDAGFSGSLIIAEFNSLQDAQVWADAEPYLAAGVYDGVTVKPFKRVLG